MPIIKKPHDKENPYVMLNKESLWDEELSLEALGLWARLMSRPPNWEVKVSELIKTLKISKNKVYKLINQLIDAGYVIRHQPFYKNEKGKFFRGEVEYLVFEGKVSEEFKKSFLLPQKQEPEKQVPEIGEALISNNISSLSTKETKEKEEINSPASLPTADASEVASSLLQAIKKTKEDIKEPNLKAWTKEVDLMLRVDKRAKAQILEVLQWLPTAWWRKQILSAKSLREKFDRLVIDMKTGQEEDNRNKNRKFVFDLIKDNQDIYEIRMLKVEKDYVRINANKELSLNMANSAFEAQILNCLGVRHV